MVDFLQIILYVMLFYILHESGHIIFAKILGLTLQGIGFSLKPIPNVYVSIKYPRSQIKKNLYLFSGTFITLCLFVCAIYFNFFSNKFLYFAFFFQLIIETNPFHSDFTIMLATRKIIKKHTKSYKELYQEQLSKYRFSMVWYIHFFIWTILFVILNQFQEYIL